MLKNALAAGVQRSPSPDPLAGKGGGPPPGRGMEGKEGEGWEREGCEGKGYAPQTEILATALHMYSTQWRQRHVPSKR